MATNPTPQRRSTPPPRSSGGGFWLFLCLVIGGAAAVFVFAPDLPRRLLGGTAQTPKDPGAEPSAAQASTVDLNDREHTAKSKLGEISTVDRTSSAAKPKPTPTQAPAAPKYKEEAQAAVHLAEAEKAYKAYEWQKAASASRKIVLLDCKPATKVRAKDIIRGSDALAKLFTELNDKDELSRNFDTHPSLVQMGSGATASVAVPIRGMDDQTVVDSEPIAWINSQRKTGKVTVLLRGKKDFIAAVLPADQVGQVVLVDGAKIKQEKLSEFNQRLARLKNGDMANDALAWYEAAKFAFRNRLDDVVTEMMDRASILDPRLVASVREDKAASLYANVVLHMKNSNSKQAAAFMAIITKRFSDTPSGKEAEAYYKGEVSNAVAMAKDAERQRLEDAKLRREARLERAKELGDDQLVSSISNEKDEMAEAPGIKASGDEGKADEFFSKGRDLYSKAIDAGNSDNRDTLYGQALSELSKAMDIYNVLLEKAGDDSGLAAKALECNKLRFGARKQQRFH